MQCSGFISFWYVSGSLDRTLEKTDPDPALFVSDFKNVNKNIFSLIFLLITSCRVNLHPSSRRSKIIRIIRILLRTLDFGGHPRPFLGDINFRKLSARGKYIFLYYKKSYAHIAQKCPALYLPLGTIRSLHRVYIRPFCISFLPG